MNDRDDDRGAKPPDDQRTVFVPSRRGRPARAQEAPANESTPPRGNGAGTSEGGSKPGDESASDKTEWIPEQELRQSAGQAGRGASDADKTEWIPEEKLRQSDPDSTEWIPEDKLRQSSGTPKGSDKDPVSTSWIPEHERRQSWGPDSQRGAPRTTINIGDCLNHIYEVKRFIARGGMGEVFEGVNVTSDERVAIKVMLPALAADPNVIAMFRREARAMTRLQHEALVQYRVLAQEPQLGILYIVTDFIDGIPLCDVLGTLKPSPDQLEMLLQRLASGLRAAHRLGVLHRDISPDNVLLESGKIERAKIVDFGIAKDLTPGSGTIIGEGFAGKLGYVAPEQLGDFNRELGPWTDVYSLALVLTAAAAGHDLQMGGTLVDAVDRRRKGVDLSAVPERLRPVFAAMLRPNPAERLRSMDEVLAMIDAGRRPPPQPGEHSVTKLPRYARIAGAMAAVLLLGGVTLWLTSGSHENAPAGVSQPRSQDSQGAPQPNLAAAADPIQAARTAINSIIPSVECSWLTIGQVSGDAHELNVAMGGVAGDPSGAQSEVISALRRAGFPQANADFSAVAPIQPGGCSVLDAYRQIPRIEQQLLKTPQPVWHRDTVAKTGEYIGQRVAKTIVTLTTDDSHSDFTLVGIEPSGVFSTLFSSRAATEKGVADSLADFRAGKTAETNPTKIGPDQYQFKADINHDGWSGLALISGQGPFPPDVVSPPLGARDVAWQNRFATYAAEHNWKADMLWFRVEGQRGGD